jgi:hypothetical protein
MGADFIRENGESGAIRPDDGFRLAGARLSDNVKRRATAAMIGGWGFREQQCLRSRAKPC